MIEKSKRTILQSHVSEKPKPDTPVQPKSKANPQTKPKVFRSKSLQE